MFLSLNKYELPDSRVLFDQKVQSKGCASNWNMCTKTCYPTPWDSFLCPYEWRELSPFDKLCLICPFSGAGSSRAVPIIQILKIKCKHWEFNKNLTLHVTVYFFGNGNICICSIHIILYSLYMQISVLCIYDGIFFPVIYLHEMIYMALSYLWALRGEPGSSEQWSGQPTILSMACLNAENRPAIINYK